MFEVEANGIYIAGGQGICKSRGNGIAHPQVTLHKLLNQNGSCMLAGFRTRPATDIIIEVANSNEELSQVYPYAYSTRKGASLKALEDLTGIEMALDHAQALASVHHELALLQADRIAQITLLQHTLGIDFEPAWAIGQYGQHLIEYQGMGQGEGMRKAVFEYAPDFKGL